MNMQRPNNLKIGDKFRVIEGGDHYNLGEIVTLKIDDGSDYPFFWKEDKSDFWSINFYKLEPVTKTVRDVRVGDVVVGKYSRYEHMVLERGQSTVLLSYGNDFKKAIGTNRTFDELEERFTLKNEPVVVSDKTAEAIKLLKEAGYTIVKN